jgi:hypothetical protein
MGFKNAAVSLILISSALNNVALAEGGRNGPDLAGKAISSSVVIFKEEQILRATKVCGTMMAKQIYEAMFKRSASSLKRAYTFENLFIVPVTYGTNEAGVTYSKKYNIPLTSITADGDTIIKGVSYEDSWVDEKGSTLTTQFYPGQTQDLKISIKLASDDLPRFADRNMRFIVPNGLPALLWSRIAEGVTRDEYATVTSSKIRLKNLDFAGSNTYVDEPIINRIFNYGNGNGSTYPTKLKVDMVKYINCLRSEIQK